MSTWDVIVAGAGPAGSTAAREAAVRGLSVVIVDKAEFPRDKPCGGGVNLRAARLLPFGLDPVVERRIYGMRISIKQGRTFSRYAPHPITYLTQRRCLDTFLLEQAEKAGARVEQRALVRTVERGADRLIVRAGRQALEGRTLIVADGANGPTAGLAGVSVARSKEIALEGNITPLREYPAVWEDAFGVDVGGIPGGYGWLFPKGDHVNIGVGGRSSIGPTLRTLLHDMVRFYGFDAESLWGVRGHPLPVRLPGAALMDGNVLITGDAAGLLDPLSGEGIYSAIWSGQTAARHIADFLGGHVPTLDGYRWEVEAELAADLIIARQLHMLFHLSPRSWAMLVHRSSRAWSLLCRLITGDETYSTMRQRSALVNRALRLSGLAECLVERSPQHRLVFRAT